MTIPQSKIGELVDVRALTPEQASTASAGQRSAEVRG
jgi:hypothetical protein